MIKTPRFYEIVMLFLTGYIFFTLIVNQDVVIIMQQNYLIWLSLGLFIIIALSMMIDHYTPKILVGGTYLIFHFYITMALVASYPNIALAPMLVVGLWIAAENYILIGISEDEKKLKILNADEYAYNGGKEEGDMIATKGHE